MGITGLVLGVCELCRIIADHWPSSGAHRPITGYYFWGSLVSYCGPLAYHWGKGRAHWPIFGDHYAGEHWPITGDHWKAYFWG